MGSLKAVNPFDGTSIELFAQIALDGIVDAPPEKSQRLSPVSGSRKVSPFLDCRPTH